MILRSSKGFGSVHTRTSLKLATATVIDCFLPLHCESGLDALSVYQLYTVSVVQWSLFILDAIRTSEICPLSRGVLNSEVR